MVDAEGQKLFDYISTHVDTAKEEFSNGGSFLSGTFCVRAAIADKRPLNFRYFPLGILLAFPDCLVFLTSQKGRPGFFMNFPDDVQEAFASAFKFLKYAKNPLDIIKDFGEYMSRSPDDDDVHYELLDLVNNENSLVIPRCAVADVSMHRSWLNLGSYIKLNTSNKNIIICGPQIDDSLEVEKKRVVALASALRRTRFRNLRKPLLPSRNLSPSDWVRAMVSKDVEPSVCQYHI